MLDQKRQTYWYKYTHYTCVICGRWSDYKERVYDRPKPESYDNRHEYIEEVCGNHYAYSNY